MKKSSIVQFPRQWLLLVACYAILSIQLLLARAQDTALTGPPPNKWFIEKPEFSSERLDLFLRYPVSDFIPYENLAWTLLDGPECDSNLNGDITDNNYLNVELTIEDETAPIGTGGGWRFVTLSFKFDPGTIRDSPILYNEGLDQRLKFCVRLGAFSSQTNVPGALEIFHKVTSMDVLITQEGLVGTDNLVTDPEGTNQENAQVAYKLRGFLCNETNQEIIDPFPIFQGMLTKVCVTPIDEALADGVYMRAIDTFYWTRETIYQPAIFPLQTPAPLTEVTCEPGMKICSFVTLLRGDFFYRLGRVYGAGVGWLQFGRGDYTGDQRKMKAIIEFQDESNIFNTIEARQAEDRPVGADYPEYAGAGPFNVDIPVTRLYRAYGWLCDKDNVELDPMKHPVIKGDIARVCVKPDDIAINQDNVRIRNIDSFKWEREDLNVTQVAITTNAVAEERTEIFCQPGSLVCALETNLVDEFFRLPGGVKGRGLVWLQFGEGSGRRVMAVPLDVGIGQQQQQQQQQQRNLQYSLEDFALGAKFLPIADPGFAGASPFDVVVYLLPPVAERELYTCRAYECDSTNKEFVANDAKLEGQSIRVCVKPSKAAEDVGVKMWSVEWWTWSQVDRIQEAIVKQGKEAPDGRTVQFCYRGMDICFFQTRLIPDFFAAPQPNALNGNGVCWLTFGDGFAFPAPIEIEDAVDNGGALIDPTEDPLYAGHNDISLNYPTKGNYTFVEEVCPPEDHTLKGWWDEQDDTMKGVYIGIITLAGTGLCCLWGLCFFCNRRKRDDEETIIKEGKNVVVNVDISERNHTEKNLETHEEYHAEKELQEETIDTKSYHSSRSLASTKSVKKPKFSGKRKKKDIAFDDEEHPGTIKLRKTVKAYIRKNPEDQYGPEPFRFFRLKFEDSYFLIRDDKTDDWREAKKSETVSRVGEIWMEEKQKAKKREGEYTREALKEMNKEEKRRKKKSKKEKD